MQISDAIRDGAEGFFRTQYGTISKMAVVLAFAILGIYTFRRSSPEQEASGLARYERNVYHLPVVTQQSKMVCEIHSIDVTWSALLWG